jgi:hypothetical protein
MYSAILNSEELYINICWNTGKEEEYEKMCSDIMKGMNNNNYQEGCFRHSNIMGT